MENVETFLPEGPSDRLGRIRDVLGTLLPVVGREAWAHAGLANGDARTRARTFTGALESLGVTFVKLGQTLATRNDLLPEPYPEELSRLNAEVAPLPFEVVRSQLSESLGAPLERHFLHIDREPLGSASIGQVHRAVLDDGTVVAVKVQRPGCREEVERDLDLLRRVVGAVEGLGGDRMRMASILETFATALQLELDYRVEARNLLAVRRTMSRYPWLSVPAPYMELTSRTVLVMAYVDGTPIDTLDEVPHGPAIARDLCRAYFDQILEGDLFHADPHAGNLLRTEDGRLHLIDLGMTERLAPSERAGVARLVLGLARGEDGVAAESLVDLCGIRADSDLARLREDVSHIVRRAMALRGIEPTLGHTVTELVRAAAQRGYEPPAQLATLGRTLAMLDGVFTHLDPSFDPAEIVDERAGRLARNRLQEDLEGMAGLQGGLLLSDLLTHGPERLDRVLRQLSEGRLKIAVDAFDERATLESLWRIANRIAGSVIVAALLIAGAMLDDAPGPHVAGLPVHSVFFLTLGGLGATTLLLSVLYFDR